MEKIIKSSSLEDRRFKTISDFKWCVKRGGEVLFEYNNKIYGISPKLKRTPESNYQILISQLYIDNQDATEKWCDTTDEVLEYTIDGVKLRSIITEVEVLDRTI